MRTSGSTLAHRLQLTAAIYEFRHSVLLSALNSKLSALLIPPQSWLRKNATTFAMSPFSSVCSRPSGINETPDAVSVVMLCRGTVSSVPADVRKVKLVSDSAASHPENERPSCVTTDKV